MTISSAINGSDSLQQQLRAVDSDSNQSLGIPPACYADDRLLALERRAVFQQGWIGLGRADRWPASGDYSALDIAGEPIIVIRNSNGELKAFANSCRHRGSQIVAGDGNCNKLKCPFHWWTYDLDGRLKVYSRMQDAVDFDAADYGLIEFQYRSDSVLPGSVSTMHRFRLMTGWVISACTTVVGI